MFSRKVSLVGYVHNKDVDQGRVFCDGQWLRQAVFRFAAEVGCGLRHC